MKNKFLNLTVLIVTSAIMVYFFIFLNGLENLIMQMRNMKIQWIIIAVITFIFFWIFETLVLYYISSSLYNKKIKILSYFRYVLIGQFFGAITPFSSGSQPSQVLAMNEDGIPAGIAASILAIKFILHEIVYFIFLIVSLIFKFNYFNVRIKFFLQFCIIGLIINAIVISMAMLVAFTIKIPKKIMILIYKFLNYIRLLKNYEEKCVKLDEELLSFHNHAKLMWKYKYSCIAAGIFTAAQWFAYYIIPYFIYRSFSMNYISIFTMITAQVFLTMFMSCIPIPGAEGGAEAGFYIIYRLFFTKNNLVPAIFIWRIVTYYFTILTGGVFTVFISKKQRKVKISD